MGIVPAFGDGVALLLAPFSPRLGSGGARRCSLGWRGVLGEGVLGGRSLGLIGAVTRLALGAVEALFEDAGLGFEFGDAGILGCFALLGGPEHGVVIVGLLSSLKEQRPIGAMRARTRRKRLEEVRGVRTSRRRVRRVVLGGGRAGRRRGRENRGGVFSSGRRGTALSGRSSRSSNPFVGSLRRPRLLRLRVVGGDHATRRTRCWNEGQFHTSTLGHVCPPRGWILPSLRLFTEQR